MGVEMRMLTVSEELVKSFEELRKTYEYDNVNGNVSDNDNEQS